MTKKVTPKQKVLKTHPGAECVRKSASFWYVQGFGSYGIFIHGFKCLGRGRTPVAAWRDAAEFR